MATIRLSIAVASLDSVRAVFTQIKVYRSTTGALGAYSELTGPATRIALESGKTLYEYVDDAGASTYYYRVSYYNSSTLQESSLSEPQQGETDSALQILSVEELKSFYLFGVDLTDEQGTAYPNSLYEFYIKAAVSYVERHLDMPLRPTAYDEQHDYDPNAWDSYIMVQTNRWPIISVEEMNLLTPAGEVGLAFDPAWLRVRKETGQINVVPSGSAGVTMLGGNLSVSPRWGSPRFFPDLLQVKYTAGFEAGKAPDAIRNVVGLIASYGPLNIAGDLVGGAGLAAASLSIDGLSQSITTANSSTNAGYGARLLEYAKQVKMYLPELRRSYKGIRLSVA